MRRQIRKKIAKLYRVENRQNNIVSYLPQSTIDVLSSSPAEIVKYDIDFETEYVYNQKKSEYEVSNDRKKAPVSNDTVETIKNQIKNKLSE